MQNVEAALVSGKPGSLHLHAAEEAHVDVAVLLATPRTSPVLELDHFLGAVGDEILDRVLVAQPIAAGYRIVEVMVEAVIRPHHTGRPAFCGDSMAAHRHDLGNQRHIERGLALSRRNRCAQTCTAASHHDYIGTHKLHRISGTISGIRSNGYQAKPVCAPNP